MVHICLKSEEGRLDEIFANLQESVCFIFNKSLVKGKVKELMTKFMEMATLPLSASPHSTFDLSSLPLEPPLPRNYLIALAMKNQSSRQGSPVMMSQVWSYLCSTFPFYQYYERWSQAELETGIGFQGAWQFE